MIKQLTFSNDKKIKAILSAYGVSFISFLSTFFIFMFFFRELEGASLLILSFICFFIASVVFLLIISIGIFKNRRFIISSSLIFLLAGIFSGYLLLIQKLVNRLDYLSYFIGFNLISMSALIVLYFANIGLVVFINYLRHKEVGLSKAILISIFSSAITIISLFFVSPFPGDNMLFLIYNIASFYFVALIVSLGYVLISKID